MKKKKEFTVKPSRKSQYNTYIVLVAILCFTMDVISYAYTLQNSTRKSQSQRNTK